MGGGPSQWGLAAHENAQSFSKARGLGFEAPAFLRTTLKLTAARSDFRCCSLFSRRLPSSSLSELCLCGFCADIILERLHVRRFGTRSFHETPYEVVVLKRLYEAFPRILAFLDDCLAEAWPQVRSAAYTTSFEPRRRPYQTESIGPDKAQPVTPVIPRRVSRRQCQRIHPRRKRRLLAPQPSSAGSSSHEVEVGRCKRYHFCGTWCQFCHHHRGHTFLDIMM